MRLTRQAILILTSAVFACAAHVSPRLHAQIAPIAPSMPISSDQPAVLIKKRATCGNGIVEDGEECDPAAPNSRECCSDDCKKRPDMRQLCASGAGICRSGVCLTRQQQCSALDPKILAIDGRSLEGPFAPCNPDSQGGNSSSGGTGNGTNVNARCTLACAGRIQSSNSQFCLDLRLYSNIDNVVTDGITCGNDEAGSSLGVCTQGVCRTSACRQTLCNRRGDCFRSGSGGVSCRCDSPYSGDRCDKSPDCDGTLDICGVCNGDGSSCANDSPLASDRFVDSTTFKHIVLPIVVVSSAFVLLLMGYISLKRSRQSKIDSIRRKNSQSRLTTSQAKLSQVSQSSSAKVGISVRFDEYRVIMTYEAQMPDELELKEGDIVFKLFEYDDGWAKGYNTRTQEEGVYPVSFTDKVVPMSRATSMASSFRG